MSGSYLLDSGPALADADLNDAWSETLRRTPSVARYAVCLLLVGLAVVLGYGLQRFVPPANLTLIFVLPVVVAATTFGWGPALATVAVSVLAFDFFFTEPLYQLTIASPTDIWAAVLLFVIASLVSAVGTQARSRAMRAQRAAQQASALQVLAHVVMAGRPPREVLQAAAIALGQIFEAPTVILAEGAGGAELVASSGDAALAAADEEAALGVISLRVPSHARTYPFEDSRFDFWPVRTPSAGTFVVGVDFARSPAGRPAAPERFIDLVGAYLAAARVA